jgi:hypothetical protein
MKSWSAVDEAVRLDRPAQRADVAVADRAHQLLHTGATIQGHRLEAVVEGEAHGLPPRPFDGADRKTEAGHARLEYRLPAVLSEIEMGRGADGEALSELGVSPGAMIALAGVLHRQLPVRRLDNHAFMGELGVRQIVRGQEGFERAPERVDIRRLICHADIEHAADALHVDGDEPVAGPVEILRHPSDVGEFARQFVGPAMIGTDQPRRRAPAGLADARAAMTAGIVKGVQVALAVAGDDHRPRADGGRHPAAGLRELHLEADHDPGAAEDRRHVEVEGFRRIVQRLRQGVAGLPRAHPAGDGVKIDHFASRSCSG